MGLPTGTPVFFQRAANHRDSSTEQQHMLRNSDRQKNSINAKSGAATRALILPGLVAALGAAMVGALAPSAAWAKEKSAPARPNIVLILADDLGWADVACNGADLHETPHIDRLASSGVRFTDAYASAPICSPTRAALLTGQYPARLHMTIWREASQKPPHDRKLIPPIVEENLSHDHQTLSQRLDALGYVTGHIGKWHLGDAGHFPETFGFDFHVAGNHWGAPPTYFFPYRGPFGQSRERRYVPGLSDGHEGEYLTDRLTDEALRFIDRAGDEPFFLNLWHYAVHTPVEAPRADVEHFEGALTPEMHHRNAAYAAMVRSLDQSVGRIVEKLQSRGIADRTVIVFTSDNGGFLGGGDRFVTTNVPLRSGKGALYEGGIRVPLIVVYPGVTPAGAICREPVASMDLYATLLDAAGWRAGATSGDAAQGTKARKEAGAPAIVDGVGLRSLLEHPEGTLERDALYWHYPHYYSTSTPSSAMRQGDWKLVEFFEDNHVELYNLRDDAGEANDRAASLPDKAGAMRRALAEWRKSVDAQYAAPNPQYRGE